MPDMNGKYCKRDLFDLVKNLFSDNNEILWICDHESGTFYASNRLFQFCGIDLELPNPTIETIGNLVYSKDKENFNLLLKELSDGNIDTIRTNIRFTHINGQIKSLEMKGKRQELTDFQGNKYAILIGVFVDYEIKRRLENQINYAMYFDALTELPNRSMFCYRVNTIINQNTSPCAIVVLDLDNFKRINDLYGYHFGDEVLKEIANIIKNELSYDEILARPGGDEFFLFFSNDGTKEMVDNKVNRIIQSINRNLSIGEIDVQMSTSAGISMYPEDGNSAEELIKNSDAAMYKAKSRGKNQSYFFNKSINEEIKKRTEMEKHLRYATLNQELYLVYQPQVDSESEEIIGLEALLRWNSKEYGHVSPTEFIPIAEETGLLIPIGYWIIENVCEQIALWIQQYDIKIPISINVSPMQLISKNFTKKVFEMIEKHHLDKKLVKIEITESTFMENYSVAANILEVFYESGLHIALDDFGTGYSSLNYLKSLPLSTLKIDKSFIDNLQEDGKERSIVGTIIELAHILGLDVVAEGVETSEQFAILKDLSCDHIQGYYFGKPLDHQGIASRWFKEDKMYAKID